MVPIHPRDRLLLGVEWRGQLYLDKVLLFGLQSAPIIFSSIGDTIEWMVGQREVELIFIVAGEARSHKCSQGPAILLRTCEDAGASCLTVLGREVDTALTQLRLPKEKLVHLREALDGWRGRKWCSKRELLSLVGSLQHAAKTVRPVGRLFVVRSTFRRVRNRMDSSSSE